MICPRCHASNDGEALFCAACGHGLRAHDVVECENHSGTIAIGICVVCGKPVCGDCSTSEGNKMYCDDMTHSQLTTAHIKLGAVATEFEADMIAKNLSLNGVPALQYSTKKFSQLCSLTDDRSVSIFVRTESIEEARRLIEDMELEEFLIHDGRQP